MVGQSISGARAKRTKAFVLHDTMACAAVWSDAHPLFYQFCVVYLEIHLLTFMDSWSQNFQHRDAKIVA